MKFPKLTSLVPQGEHFDESAIINEGCYLSIGHINSIESAFVAHDSVVEQIANLSTEKTELQNQLATATNSSTELTGNLETANARIAALEAENAKLKTEPAGGFQATTTTEDPITTPLTGKSKYHTSIDDEAMTYSKR